MYQQIRSTLWKGSLLSIYFLYIPGWAQSSSCQTPSTVKDLLSCVVESHPKVNAAKLEVEKSVQIEDVARQRQNPNLNSRNLFPIASQAKGINTEIDLAQPLELGGKRKSRIEGARAEKLMSAASLRVVQQEVLIETLLDLHRLRQIDAELEVYNETVSTYGHIQKQFKRRSQLTPEQQVATSVFHLAEVDTLFQKTSLLSEKNGILAELEYAVGQPISIQPSLLPTVNLSEIELSATGNPSVPNALVQQGKANLSLAKAELQNQKSQSWPNLNIGPSFNGNSLGSGDENHEVGFNLSIGIPVLQRNKAGVALAQKDISIAERSLDFQQRAVEVQRRRWKNQYDLARSVLTSGIKTQEIESKHKKVESLYDRGFLPSSMVIEAHRQVLDYARHQHEQELLASEARYQLYALDGRLLEEEL